MRKYLVTLLLLALATAALLWLAVARGGEEKHDDSLPAANLIAVDASVYRGLMEMLGIGSRCVDFSDTMNPDGERIVASGATILLLSAYDGIDSEKYRRLGLHVVECRDFLETSPLARAAWMKRLGREMGVATKADSLYQQVERHYQELCHSQYDGGGEGKQRRKTPTVMFDMLYGAQWYQPSVQSTIGRMVADAGGRLPFGISRKGGSEPLSKEQMVARGNDADVWIVRYQADHELTLRELATKDPVYRQFRALREGRVWGVNTATTRYYEEAPFRPDLELDDFIHIVSDTTTIYRPHYYHRLK